MTEEIWIGIDEERIKLEGELLENFLAERQSYLETKAAKEALEAEKKLKQQEIFERLGLTEDEVKVLLG